MNQILPSSTSIPTTILTDFENFNLTDTNTVTIPIFSCVSSSKNYKFTNRQTNGVTLSSVQNSSGQERSEEVGTVQDSSGQLRTGRDRSGQVGTGQDRSRQDRTGLDRTGNIKTGQDNPVQVQTGKDKSRSGL